MVEPKWFSPLPGIAQDYNRMEKHVNKNLDNRQAFLVRLWRDSPQEPWRASVKEVTNGREFFFASLEKLFLFLYTQTTELNSEGVTDVA
jgi:hypothetical protein